MPIDPRLDQIDDCLYRVAVRVLIVQACKVLLVQENEQWWACPGGGVAHGEAPADTLRREVREELGVPAGQVSSDFRAVYYNIGTVVDGVPRMNIYFKAAVPEQLLQQTTEVATWQWFSHDEFMQAALNPSYDKAALASVIFGA